MSFLSIIFLAALPLAFSPVLLHLFDRRRKVMIEWGAMQFLEEASTQRTSARRLKQWLLLALRMLAVAALVLALARPMLPGHWLGGTEQSETIVVIDNSMSTQRSIEETTLLAKIQERVREELASLPPGMAVRVLQSSPYPIWVTPHEYKLTGGMGDRLERQLAGVQSTSGGGDLLASLFTAIQADPIDKTSRRHVVLVTDGQAADWRMADTSGWERLQEALRTASLPTQLSVIEVRPAPTDTRNIAINALKSSRLLAGVGQTFSLAAHVQNYSTVETSGLRMRWIVAGREETLTEIPSLPPGDTHEATWRHAFTRPGVFSVSCEIIDDGGRSVDSLSSDNRATVVVEVRDEIPVLVVEAASGQSELQQDSYFLQAAMGWINGEALDQHSVFRPVLVKPGELASISLSDFRAVVVPNFTQLAPETIDRLKLFAMNGGGVWIAMGPRADVEQFNQSIYAAGDGLSALAIEGIVSEPDPKKSPTINPAGRGHPATAELADSNRLDTTDIRVRRRFRFAQPTSAQDVSVLLGLSSGEPLAIEKSVGQGRVIVMGLPLMLRDWSDLARSQAYVVMVQDWLNYLTQPQATRHNLLPGDPIVLHLPEGSHREAFLKTPVGETIELAAEPLIEGVMFRSTRTILPGDYVLQLGLSGESIPFHVQRSVGESNLAELTPDNRRLLRDTANLSQNTLASGATSHTQRDPVWPFLLLLLIAFMSCELVLAGMISRERFGTEAIPETVEPIAAPLLMSPSSATSQPRTLEQSAAGR